jgi:hypothetical protein
MRSIVVGCASMKKSKQSKCESKSSRDGILQKANFKQHNFDDRTTRVAPKAKAETHSCIRPSIETTIHYPLSTWKHTDTMTGFWLVVAICMVATIGGSSAFTVLPPRTTTTRTTGPKIFLSEPRTRPRYRQPHLRLALHMIGDGGGMGIGIQTAQMLLDKRRHEELKQNMRKDYPLVPESVLDICIGITAEAFTTVAPEKIRMALKPGAMQQSQPELKKSLVRTALDQQVIRDIPVINTKDKEALLGTVVDLALRFVLKDATAALAAPEVRLQALEEQVRQVKAQMGPWRLALYRLRNNILQVATPILVALSVALLYTQRDDPRVATVTSIARRVFSKVVVPLLTLVQTEVSFMFNDCRSQFNYCRSKVMSWL